MNDLIQLLRSLRDGATDPAVVEQARVLLRTDARLDDELRAVALADETDLAGDAAGLLAVLGADDLGALIAEAIAEEGGSPPSIGADDLQSQDWSFGPAIAAAVRAEAGAIDVVGAVLEACGLHVGQLPVAAAVRSEAGAVDLTPTLRDALGWPHVDVAAAVRAEAGRVDVVSDVMKAIALPQTPPYDLARPANDTRAFAVMGLVLAAAVALFVSLAGIETGRDAALPTLAFAHADEVVVEDLTSTTDVLMLQGEGQDGALILWVDEET